MPSLKLTHSVSSNTTTTTTTSSNAKGINKLQQQQQQPPAAAAHHFAPFSPLNTASTFANTITSRTFQNQVASYDTDVLRKMRTNNIHPALYSRLPSKLPAPPEPTGGEGCVDLEKVNERLMEFVRRARAEKERREAKERIARKAETRKACAAETSGKHMSKEARRTVEGRSRANRQSYPPAQSHSQQQQTVNPQSVNNNLSRSASPWSLLASAHTRINFPPLSRSLSPTSPTQQQPLEQQHHHHQRRFYDRPDWSESDELAGGAGGRGAGALRTSTGLRLLVKRSESVLRRGGGIGAAVDARSKDGGMGIPERRVVMRMQNDSVVSREVGAAGWRCGCWKR